MRYLFFGSLVVLALLLAYRSPGNILVAAPKTIEAEERIVVVTDWEQIEPASLPE